MSLSGSMGTAISGMNAQSNRLSSIGDNVANSDTVGYKRSKISFSSFLVPNTGGEYNSGGVSTVTGREVSAQGEIASTTSSSNLAISGKGFFVVQDQQGAEYLTRAGDFELDDSGDLMNSGGFALLGYSFAGGTPANQINGLSGLMRINLRDENPRAAPTTKVGFSSSLDVRKPVVAASDLPGSNLANSKYTHKTSVTTYDTLGRELKYDIYFAKKADATGGATPADAEWQVAIYRSDKSTNGGFPYTAAPSGNTATFKFDSNGDMISTTTTMSITDNVSVPAKSTSFDFSGLKLIASDFSPTQNNVDGHAASWVKKAAIDTDGTVYAVYSDGSREPRFRIPLANVQSPDKLEAHSGNVFTQGIDSGTIYTGFPGEGTFGTTLAGKVEKSNVDMSAELTEMILAQRNYTANSKAFQTGSELLDVLVNLKR